ncbi:MAG TPA: hypothetical protein VHF89_15690 [Solirubrobacteraceae bacterium]|nr:hypothetical protein [Solirubrobacteraceae bacterium]
MRIGARFEGPPGVANGGYLAGSLAGAGPAQVTIRRPVPLEAELELDEGVLRAGDDVLAQVEPVAAVDVGEVPLVTPEQARAAGARTPFADCHPFPRCFGCGPVHPSGLHCLPGPVDDRVWAVAWTPEETRPPFVWAALDCASAGPICSPTGVPAYVLGRIEAEVREAPASGRPHAVVAWALGGEGRRHHAASAVLDGRGTPLAVARATWFAV